MTQLRLSLLGMFSASLAEQPLTRFPTDKIRALLAYLAMEADRPFRREVLAALLWPDWPDDIARRNLRQSLHRLNQVLNEVIPGFGDELLTLTRQTAQLNGKHLILDVQEFVSLLSAVSHHSHRHLHICQPCLDNLKRAAMLYQGELLAGFSLGDAPAFAEWLLVQRESLHQQMLLVLHNLADACEQRREYEPARHYAARQLALEPWREEAHRQLMRVLALSGQRSQALAQYETCRRVLADELGVEPAPETAELYQHIQNGRFPITAPITHLHHVPTPFTRFVGREAELAHITAQLTNPDCRLLTLVGPGGIGKTRLAIEVITHLANSHPGQVDDIYFISLASLDSADLLPQALAGSLDLFLGEVADILPHVFHYLRSRRAWLVLDNFEHLLGGVSWLLQLLQVAPDVKLLITSRQPLNLTAEHRLMLYGLTYPETPVPDMLSYSAIQLFAQAAGRVRPGFTISKAEETAVWHICHAVQGMPLAIEMAAAWVNLLSPTAIAEQIRQNLDLLVTTQRDVPDRHRSLRVVFDYSWQSLSPVEQAVLAQASVFRGPFSREALEAVTQAGLPVLASLMDKSLLGRLDNEVYTLHELLRHFAAEKLAEQSDVTYGRHMRYYLGWVAQQGATLHGNASQAVLMSMHQALDNIRQAWNWAVTHTHWEQIAASVDGLATFYQLAGFFQEGYESLETAVLPLQAALPAMAPTLISLRRYQGDFLSRQGKMEAAITAVQTALDVATDHQLPAQQARAQVTLGRLLRQQGRYAEALTHITQAQQWYEQNNDLAGLALTFNRLATIYHRQGQYDLALTFYRRALTLNQSLGRKRDLAADFSGIGTVYSLMGVYEQAIHAYEQALQYDQESGNREGVARRLTNLGAVYRMKGDDDQALAYYRQVLPIFQELGHQEGIATVVGNMGLVYWGKGEYDQALSCYQRALQVEELLGHQEGIARHLSNMGRVYQDKGDYAQALNCFDQAIPLLRQLEAKYYLANSLIGRAEVLFLCQCYEEAAGWNEEGAKIAEEIGRRTYLHRSWVLGAKLAAVNGDRSGGMKRLQQLLTETSNEDEQAALHYELWQMRAEGNHAEVASALYEKLLRQGYDAQYTRRLTELQAARPF